MTVNKQMTQILIGNIRVSVSADEDTILKKAREKMKRAGFATTTLHFHLYKRSVDARKRDEICFVCSVLAESDAPAASFPADRLKKADARIFENQDLDILQGSELMRHRPMVVGMGPAGLFAALLLARNGYAPILIDRGGSVEERVGDVSHFREKGQLDTESNIQFGAGGAGTFSDGKLVTRIHDPKCGFVLQTLYDFGAPEEILVKVR